MGEVERAIVYTLDAGALAIGEAGSVGSVQRGKCTVECSLVGFLIGGKHEERTGIVGVGVKTDVVGFNGDSFPVVEIEGRSSVGRGSDVEPANVVGVGRDGPFASVEGLNGFVCGKGFHLARTCAEVTGNHGEHLVVGSGVHLQTTVHTTLCEVECLVDVTPVERGVILQLVVVVLVTIVAMAFVTTILEIVGCVVTLEVDGVEHGVVRVGGQRDGEIRHVDLCLDGSNLVVEEHHLGIRCVLILSRSVNHGLCGGDKRRYIVKHGGIEVGIAPIRFLQRAVFTVNVVARVIDAVEVADGSLEGRLVHINPIDELELSTGIRSIILETKVPKSEIILIRCPIDHIEIIGIFGIGGNSLQVVPTIYGRSLNSPLIYGLRNCLCCIFSYNASCLSRTTRPTNRSKYSIVNHSVHFHLNAFRSTGEIECLIGVTIVCTVSDEANLIVICTCIITRLNCTSILCHMTFSSVHVDDIFHRCGFVGGQRDGESHVVETAVELRHGCGECRFLCCHFNFGGIGVTKDGDGSADGTFQVLKVFEGEVRVGNIVRLHHGVALNVGFVAAVLEGGGVVNGSFQRPVSLHNSFGSH